MKNKFYSEFDFERLKPNKRENDYRTPFQIDRDRIIHSSEFRRLQGKTQVFLPGEYDFYRTRLTHSIEVAQIGRAVCNYLLSKEKELLNEEYFIDDDLVESICLAHDLGHPPFGHAGERMLNMLMKSYGGFEGNAQTLRIITEIFYREDDRHRGMNPTRAFLDGILKYKVTYKQFKIPDNHFIYDEHKRYINYLFGGKKLPKDFSSPEKLNQFQSIECQIMDWADDTAYAINDLVDSISGGFITIAKLARWQYENNLNEWQNSMIDEMFEWMKSGNYKKKFGAQIGNFVRACSLKERKTFMDRFTNRYKYILIVEKNIFERAQLYKKISADLVFRSPQLHQIEFKGNSMIEKMFKLFEDNYIKSLNDAKLLPNFNDKLIRAEKDKLKRARIICDYISGATDSFALRTYRRLFDPDYSSLADLVN
ncbi:MAG: dGTP triphosphohydrolase [Bacteroidota bacterium]